jgi:hypothetical protein
MIKNFQRLATVDFDDRLTLSPRHSRFLSLTPRSISVKLVMVKEKIHHFCLMLYQVIKITVSTGIRTWQRCFRGHT